MYFWRSEMRCEITGDALHFAALEAYTNALIANLNHRLT
ncbi:hypothetical protein imdm_197 [gamma proteobacterium IMCC2047]|nr:hypothetical protein imdm_197 [gamma proteobacterium IMCC2047]